MADPLTGQPPTRAPDDPLDEQLLTPAEVAALLRVDVKTVHRWAKKQYGLTIIRVPSGHRRFRAREIRNIMRGLRPDGAPLSTRAKPI